MKERDELHFYRKITRTQKLLTSSEEEMLLQAWQRDNNQIARDKILLSHMPLVMKLASNYKGYGFPPDELISEGQLGLLSALRGFDASKGFRFSTYALWWVKAHMKDYILRNWSCVRIGTTAAQKKLFFKLKGAKKEFLAHGYEHLSDEELEKIAEELNVCKAEVEDMDNRLSGADSSLNAFIGGFEDTQAQDLMADESPAYFEKYADDQEINYRRAMMESALLALKPIEYDVILGRRLQEPPLTLEELALEKGLSRERIRQIELATLEKLETKIRAQMRTGNQSS